MEIIERFPRKRKGKFRKWLPGRCNKMIDYVNKENMESVRGIENPGMMGEMGKIIGFYRLYRQTAEEEWEEKASYPDGTGNSTPSNRAVSRYSTSSSRK